MSERNSARERILERIRAALAIVPPSPPAPLPPLSETGIFDSIADPLARFQAECAANRTELYLVETGTIAGRLEAVLASGGGENAAGNVFAQDSPEIFRLAEQLPETWRRRIRWSSTGPARGEDAAGLTRAEALVARTGSVLVSSACGGRAGSVLPPLHVVFAHLSQLVPEIEDALDMVRQHGVLSSASLLSLITGPSRTSDIEKMLVLGAHGPRRLVVLLHAS